MNKYRFHLLGLVHVPQALRYSSCAFTQKNLKLAKMLTDLGHEVIFYGSEGSDVSKYVGRGKGKLTFVQTHTLDDIRRDYGEGDNRFELGYDHNKKSFKHDFNEKKKSSTIKYYSAVISYMMKNKKDDDFLLLTQGTYQKFIADAVKLYLTIEPGVGYRGSFANFRAFESSYIQNFTYGSQNPFKSINGNYYDRVIPNYFDPDDFEMGERKDYYLFVGRLIERKGIWTAIKTTQAIGAKLIIAGQEDEEVNVNTFPSNCKFVGAVDKAKRKKLMGSAIATFVPSAYLEPFAGVHVESMLSGAPPITTNFGVFPETIPDFLDGQVGFRCNTLYDFVKAAKKASQFTPDQRKQVSGYASQFLMNNVQWKYQKWFDDLYQLYLSASIEGEKGWHHL